MGLETGTYISDLNPANATPGDPKSQGDDHLRLIKYALRQSFPFIAGPVPIAHDQIASKDYCNQLAFSTALPAQPGGATTNNLTSTGGSATWQPTYLFENDMQLAMAQAIAFSN